MKIDLNEMKRQLDVFIESPEVFITLRDLGVIDAEDAEREFRIGQLLLLIENGCISDRSLTARSPDALGLIATMNGWAYASTPVRLTLTGYDFVKILNQKPVLERLLKEAHDVPFCVISDAGQRLAKRFLEQKLGL